MLVMTKINSTVLRDALELYLESEAYDTEEEETAAVGMISMTMELYGHHT